MIGIDLGTTHSLVAYWHDDKAQAEVIPNKLEEDITPSVVSVLANGEFLIGRAAKGRLLTHPLDSASVFKRKMAAPQKFRLGTHRLTAIELSALMLKQLKEDAEAHLKIPITDAVISVPAYFNDAQRQATRIAAEMAELNVCRLINEPTAAAIAYGIHENIEDSCFLVVDLGGGTLDVSVLEIFDGVIEVHASAGDNYLGGEDFTQLLIEDFCQTHQLALETLNAQTRNAIYTNLNSLKEDLTTSHEASTQIRIDTGGTKDELSYRVDRKRFDELSSALLKRIRVPIERVIRDGKLSPEQIKDVVLVGGATRMPSVRKLVGTLLRRLPSTHIDPDKVVAIGAAIQAGLHKRATALKDIVLTDVSPYSMGVEVVVEKSDGSLDSGHFLPVIERNTTIPVSRAETLHTVYKDQEQIRCNIYQGESRLTRNNIKLGTLQIDVPAAPAGEQSVDIRFTYNNDGILEVVLKRTGNDKEERVVINNSGIGLSEAEIQKSIDRVAALKIHPRDDYPNTLLISQLEQLYEESLGTKREYIAQLLQNFEDILEHQDLELAAKHRAQLKPEVQRLLREGDVL